MRHPDSKRVQALLLAPGDKDGKFLNFCELPRFVFSKVFFRVFPRFFFKGFFQGFFFSRFFSKGFLGSSKGKVSRGREGGGVIQGGGFSSDIRLRPIRLWPAAETEIGRSRISRNRTGRS